MGLPPAFRVDDGNVTGHLRATRSWRQFTESRVSLEPSPDYVTPDAARINRNGLESRSGVTGPRRFEPARTFVFACFAAAHAFLVLPTRARAQEDEAIIERMRYFYEMRAYPFAAVPAGAFQRAYRQMTTRWPDVIARDQTNDISAGATAWTAIGPAPIAGGFAGRTSSVAVHPDDPATIYIGAAQGGVWKTTDGGATWVALTDKECSLAMGSIALDPANPQIVYAGTGELHFSGDSYYGCGVLRSTDGGASWTQLGASVFDTNSGGARVGRIVIDPTSAGSTSATTVYAATSSGFFRSQNSGLAWTRTLEGVSTDVAVDPVNPSNVYVAIGSTVGGMANGIYKSTDRGATFTRLSNGLPGTNIGRIALSLSPSTPAVVYAAIQDAFGEGGSDGQLLGIWKTLDAGATWTKLAAAGADCGSQCWYDLVIAADPLNSSTVYFGGVLLYRSDDGGGQFRNITRTIHVDQHTIAFDPTNPATVFIGNDGGIFRTNNRGTSWTSLNTNLAITQFYPGISTDPFNPNVVIGGTQDNGTLQFSGTDLWDVVLGGDGGFTAIDYIDATRSWAETQWTPSSGFSGPRLRVGSNPFSAPMTTGIDLSDRALFIPPLVLDRTDPNVLYFGTFRLYRTVDGGNLWTPLTGDLTRGTGRVSAIAPAASDPSTIYVGTNDGNLHVSRDNGASFALRTTGLPNRAVTDIAVNGLDPAVAIAVVSGFGTGHVFRTTNFGLTWADISGNLPDAPVSAALTDPGLGDEIYIGSDLGVFRTSDQGTTWSPFTEGLPNVAVFDLIYSTTTGYALAATHGRGMFAFRPAIVSALVIAQDTLEFASLQDTVRLTATALDSIGAPIAGPSFFWRSLDPVVARVDALGTVVALANGETRVIATYAGAADTVVVRVDQVVVNLVGLPDSLTLVIGERTSPPVQAVDARGQVATNATIDFVSSNPAVLSADPNGTLTALAIGTAQLHVSVDSFMDSSFVRVAPAATAAITASSAAIQGTPRSMAGTRLPLLVIRFRVSGIEAVEITRLGFEVSGIDPGASLLLVRDTDHDGQPGPSEPILATFAVNLQEGQSRQVTLSTNGFLIGADAEETLIVVLGLSGRSPNGASFSATFLPGQTSSIGTRSGARDQLDLPTGDVASGTVTATVLAPGEQLSFSENPVRSASVIFNFAQTPTTAAVYTVTGRRVVDLTRLISGGNRVEWDLRNEEGTRVAPGVYLVIFDIDGSLRRERLLIVRPPDDDLSSRTQPAGRSYEMIRSHSSASERATTATTGSVSLRL
jgi:photosystem II stability/assembly factor-like uncharacterized protein